MDFGLLISLFLRHFIQYACIGYLLLCFGVEYSTFILNVNFCNLNFSLKFLEGDKKLFQSWDKLLLLKREFGMCYDWLGIQDSNLASRIQSPLSYR